MFLANHPINRILNDHRFWFEVASIDPVTKKQRSWTVESLKRLKLGIDPDYDAAPPEDSHLLNFLCEHGKIFMVTDTVLDKLDLLKVKMNDNGGVDWTVFRSIPEMYTATFILPNNEMMRIRSYHNMIFIMIINYRDIDTKTYKAKMNVHYVYIEKPSLTGCYHLQEALRGRSEYIYKLMAFIYLSDIEEEVLRPGQSKGTKKTGKTINTIGHDITIINSKWNITSIRNESFGVSGHFAIRWCGPGKTEAKVVWIDPFTKNGYTRKAKILTQNQ